MLIDNLSLRGTWYLKRHSGPHYIPVSGGKAKACFLPAANKHEEEEG